MRKILLTTLVIMLILLSGCKNDNVVLIRDKMFIEQCNDIYLNPERYKNKVIKIEGIYEEITIKDGTKYHLIYRRTPGCCGDDGKVGFLFNYDGKMPSSDDWIRVSGVIEVVQSDTGRNNVTIRVTKLEVLKQRGVEFVTN